jgi:hypothetical protein
MSDFAAARVDMPRGQTVAMASHGSDQGLYVEFYMHPSPAPDKELSEEAGMPVYNDIPWVKIMVPGDRTKVWDRPAKLVAESQTDGIPPDNKRFREQWEAFQNHTRKATSGLPVEEWAAITRSEAESLKRMDIHTVEQMAALPDSSLSWLGARQRRDQAAQWLESAKGHATEAKLIRENEQLKAQIEALQAQVKDIAEHLGTDIEPATAHLKPGRPRKEN